MLGRRHPVRCRSYLPAVRTIQDAGGGIQVIGGAIRDGVETIQDAGGDDANAAGKFRSWTAPFGVRAPAFGSLPKLSTRCRKIPVVDGAIQVVGGTIQESVERILLAVRPDRDAADKGEA